jgi:hypothetical protein
MTDRLNFRQPALGLSALALICAAALPAAARNVFDGKWTIEDSSQSCMVKSGSWTLIVRAGAVSAPGYYPATGSISPTGVSNWTRAAKKDGKLVTYSGEFHGNVGSGAYVSSATASCSGEFHAKRR